MEENEIETVAFKDVCTVKGKQILKIGISAT